MILGIVTVQCQIYRIVPDAEAEQDGDVRIKDESGDDHLYFAGRTEHTERCDPPGHDLCVCQDIGVCPG